MICIGKDVHGAALCDVRKVAYERPEDEGTDLHVSSLQHMSFAWDRNKEFQTSRKQKTV
jgi:hypothetical protein